MTASLLSSGFDDAEMRPIWRAYWGRFWHRAPNWPARRLRGFLGVAEARKEELVPLPVDVTAREPGRKHVLRAPLLLDFPDGKAPFLGVLTTDGAQEASAESGVLQFPEPGHLLTIAPTRTGKGASHIIPNLLLYAGSAAVIDIKGENYAVTGEFRRRMYPGARVIRFAPFERDTDRYNPLDFVRTDGSGPSPDTFDDARLLADMLIPGKAKEEYWDVESRNLVTMLVIYVASRYPFGAPERAMAEVARLLFRTDATAERRGFDITLSEIHAYARGVGYRPLLALATGFLEHDAKVQKNILSSCRADLRIWNSQRLQNATSRSDFTFADLKASMCRPVKDAPAPTTLYIVIPPEYLQSYRAVVRIMVGLGVIELTRQPMWSGAPGWSEAPPCPVMFLLDELPALGHMEPIINGLAYLAGYHVQLWSFAQNLGQLRDIYGDAWHNFPANAAVTSFFGVNDPDTAEFVSRQLGESEEEALEYQTTSVSQSESESRSSGESYTMTRDGGTSHSDNRSDSTSSTIGKQFNVRFVREPLARASEVRALHKDLQLVFIRNTKPILSTKLTYYNFPLFSDLYGSWRGSAALAEARG